MPAVVQHQDAVLLRKLINLVSPVRSIAGIAMNEHYRLTGVTVGLVVDADVVDCREGQALKLWQRVR